MFPSLNWLYLNFTYPLTLNGNCLLAHHLDNLFFHNNLFSFKIITGFLLKIFPVFHLEYSVSSIKTYNHIMPTRKSVVSNFSSHPAHLQRLSIHTFGKQLFLIDTRIVSWLTFLVSLRYCILCLPRLTVCLKLCPILWMQLLLNFIQIFLKLYMCFCQGLKMCMAFCSTSTKAYRHWVGYLANTTLLQF